MTSYTHVGFRHYVPEMSTNVVVKVHISNAAAYVRATGEWVCEAYDVTGRKCYAKSWMMPNDGSSTISELSRIGVGSYGDATILSRNTDGSYDYRPLIGNRDHVVKLRALSPRFEPIV